MSAMFEHLPKINVGLACVILLCFFLPWISFSCGTVEFLKILEREALSVRAAQARTGIAAADFSRIRNADLRRFTADRLMLVLGRLGKRVDVKVRVRPVALAS